MVFTDDESLRGAHADHAIQGEDPQRKYYHIELGHNFRMTELQAAIGLAQLGKLDAFLADRQQLARQYDEEISAHRRAMPAPACPKGATAISSIRF